MGETIRLIFKDTKFVEGKTSDDIYLDLDDHHQGAIQTFEIGTSNILKRTAIRQARSIVKTGFLLTNGIRIGQEFHLKFRGDIGNLLQEMSETKVEKKVSLPPPSGCSLEEDFSESFFPIDNKIKTT